MCRDRAAAEYDCGVNASIALRAVIEKRSVAYEWKDTDRFGHIVAVCHVGDLRPRDELVRQGWAVAFWRYSTMYVGLEDQAREAKRGMWAGTFTSPWDWRAGERTR